MPCESDFSSLTVHPALLLTVPWMTKTRGVMTLMNPSSRYETLRMLDSKALIGRRPSIIFAIEAT
jgi:hypothetical protein